MRNYFPLSVSLRFRCLFGAGYLSTKTLSSKYLSCEYLSEKAIMAECATFGVCSGANH